MVDFKNSQLWAWDARPYPAFPSLENVWADAPNWETGHWLNGRLGRVRLADLIAEILLDNGVGQFDVSKVYGTLEGYIDADAATGRRALEVIVLLFQLSVFEDQGKIIFRSPGYDQLNYISKNELVWDKTEPLLSFKRKQEVDIPTSTVISHIDPITHYQTAQTQVRRINGSSLRQQQFSAPMVLDRESMASVLESWMSNQWTQRDSVKLNISRKNMNLTIGDEVVFEDTQLAKRWRIDSIEEGEILALVASAVEQPSDRGPRNKTDTLNPRQPLSRSKPHLLFIDLPHIFSDQTVETNLVAATTIPWLNSLALYASPNDEGYSYHQTISNSAVVGVLTEELTGSVVHSRWDKAGTIEVRLFTGSLASEQSVHVLNGVNGLAVRSITGAWEVIQFRSATLVGPNTWKLSGLLRGQAGTEIESYAGAEVGADTVFLNQAVMPLENISGQRGLELNWMAGPVGGILGDEDFTHEIFTPGYRGLKPYSPARLKTHFDDMANLEISWLRRDRINSDDWEQIEIPMSEAVEQFEVQINGTNSNQISLQTSQPNLVVSDTMLQTAFGAGQTILNIQVSQYSATFGFGAKATTTFQYNS